MLSPESYAGHVSQVQMLEHPFGYFVADFQLEW